MTRDELLYAIKVIVSKCDCVINNPKCNPSEYIQDKVEDIAEICNRILDGDYGYVIENDNEDNLK